MPDDDAQLTRPERLADRGPWPAEPVREPPAAPTLEERLRRIEISLWTGGEPPTWVAEAVANENAAEA